MFKIKSYLAPAESFAPYKYALKHIPDLHDRYAELARNIGSQDDLETPEFGPVAVHICWNSSGQKPLDINDVISKRAFSAIKPGTDSDRSSLRQFLESDVKKKETAYVSLLILGQDCHAVKEIQSLKGLHENLIVLVITDDQKKSKESSGSQKAFKAFDCLYYTLKEKINSDIGDLLERKVLKTIKTKCENVSIWLDEKKRLDSEQNASKHSHTGNRKRKAFVDAESKIKEMSPPKRSSIDTWAGRSWNLPVLRSLSVHNKKCNTPCNHVTEIGKGIRIIKAVKAVEKVSSPCRQVELQRINVDTFESLLAEILALYSSSNVPDEERPNISGKRPRRTTDEVEMQIFHLGPAIKGMGYRFNKFVISIENEKDDREVRRRIIEILQEHGIEDFEIEVVSKDVKHYGCDVKVGTKILTYEKVSQGKRVIGTLGCFAYMKKQKETDFKRCALLSQHVASCCELFGYYPGATNDITTLGQVIKESVSQTNLDIAAMELDGRIKVCAKFRIEEVDETHTLREETEDTVSLAKSQSDTRNKGGNKGDDSKNDTDALKGKLYRYIEDQSVENCGILRNGQRVYIWGAESNPGKGVITMCKYKVGDMKALIRIEDRVPKAGEFPERFCKPGDSGAIVCAEDSRGRYVHLIAMLIGRIEKADNQEDPKCREKYLALPLSSGLQELKSRTGYSFEIFECIDT